jgi:hypothetical protein
MVAGFGSALHGKARGFVQRDDIAIIEDDKGFDKFRTLGGDFTVSFFAAGYDRGYTHDLAGFELRVRLGAFAIDAELALADEFLHKTIRNIMQVLFKPAV